MRKSHAAAAVVAGAGLVMLSVSVVRLWPATRQGAAQAERLEQPIAPEPSVIAARYSLSAEEGAGAVADVLAESIHSADGGDAATLNSLRSVTRDAIAAYLSEHQAEFNRYLASIGVAPIGDGSTGDSQQWVAFRRCFADARFDPESVAVVCRTRGGAALPVPEFTSVHKTERPKARPAWAQSPRESYEMRVSGLFHAYAAGSPLFEATLGLEFAHDPVSGEWVLIRARLYDVPNGVTVVDPPA